MLFDLNREPQKAYNWEIEVYPSTSPVGNLGTSLKFYAKSVNIPVESTDTVKRYYAGRKYHVALKDSSPSMFMVNFWDNQNLDVYSFFRAQRDLTLHTTDNLSVERSEIIERNSPLDAFAGLFGGDELNTSSSVGGKPSDYQLEVIIRLCSNLGATTAEFHYSNCLVSEVGEVPLNYSDSSEFSFDVRFDYAKSKVVVKDGTLLGDLLNVTN